MDPPEVVDVAGDGLPHVPLDNPQPVGDTQPSPPLAPAEGTAQNEAPGENPDPKG
jgi:hypothetical protein